MNHIEWIDMNDGTFSLIKRENTRSSENVLAINDKGAMLVGRIHKHEQERYGYALETYLGGGFNNVTKFVKCDDLLNNSKQTEN